MTNHFRQGRSELRAQGARPTAGSVESQFRGARVLVTGGAGFIGSRVVRRLADLGTNVVVLDDFRTGHRELIPADMAEVRVGSVEDPQAVRDAMQGCDFVFHLAARNIVVSTSEILSDYSVNIGGTLNVLLAACELDPTPRVVYSSSASVYGNPRSLPITEDDGVSVLSPYAASKLAGESYCSAFFEMYELPVVVIRYSNVYGINQSPLNPYCGVISKFIEACLNKEPMRIHGSGLQTRDFTYVDDAVAATLAAVVVPRGEGEIINVASGCETSIRDLAAMVADAVGVPCRTEFVDRRDVDNVQRRVLSIERARRLLRWIPETPLDKGLAVTSEWLRSHREEDRARAVSRDD